MDMRQFRYPPTRRVDVVDDYHGTNVADPYRWLEDLGAAETNAWIDAQNAATSSVLDKLPMRATLAQRLTRLWSFPRMELPLREAGQLWYRHNAGLQKQAPLYRRASLTAEPELLLDPNAMSADGSVALAYWQPSPDGRYLAYALSEGGADWAEVRVREIATGSDLPDVVRWFRFSEIAWTKDSKGFYYARFPEPPAGKALEAALANHQVHYHRIGTTQDQDRLIYWRRDLPCHFVGAAVTDDGRYLLITLYNGTDPKNRLLWADLGDPMSPRIDAPIVAIVDDDIARLSVIGNDGPVLTVWTDLDAPNRRIVAIDPRQGADPKLWRSIVPESVAPLELAHVGGGKLFCQYLVDVKSEVRIFSSDGRAEGTLDLPAVACVSGMSGSEHGDELFYMVASPLAAPRIFRYDIASRTSASVDAAPAAFDSTAYETRQVYYSSRDGTRVPMFITARKGLVLDGSHPVWLYGYGGFAICVLPNYRPDLPAWLEMGGVFAQPSLRGGAEYGETWHRAGMLERKQNVFDDFIGAAEYLIAEKYTTAKRLVIEGRSNGGLLVGAAMTQRPDLFAVALPTVGVLDMLRYDRFTGGAAWTVELGSAQAPAAFEYLIRYSPLHNLKPGVAYPATLVVTADHDDRVVPSHSYKFAAALQAVQVGDAPALIRIERQGSHGYRPTDRLIAERADMLAFAASRLGLALPAS
jgi:prolyl oligopeptidase